MLILLGIQNSKKRKAFSKLMPVVGLSSFRKIKLFSNQLSNQLRNNNWTDKLVELEYSKIQVEELVDKITNNKFSALNTFNILFAVLVGIVAPFIFWVNIFVPEESTFNLFGLITITSHGFFDVATFIWFFGIKAAIILVLCVWFVASEHWWRYAILSPIIIFSYQLWGGIANTTRKIDELEYFKALPIILLIVLLLISLSRLVNYQYRIMELKKEVDRKIDELLLAQVNNNNATIQETKSVLASMRENGGCAESQLRDLEAIKEKLLQSLKENKKKRG